MELKTEFEFILPRGYVDSEGNVHREGVMRLATARDEILPQRDPRDHRDDPDDQRHAQPVTRLRRLHFA